ncbi:MAG TPA: hypothetical protein PKY77_08935 [Phycisphaerae bacterium]|nr:hypothetical protein [Phycisphaerae bacterium]HRY68416.1 hypothetical protein [Phycisphaerae bacterium]HSA27833.1 hypothetical protein [Phycisphaerae bacterium]
MKALLLCGVVLLAVTASAAAWPLADGGFEDGASGSGGVVVSGPTAGSLAELPWMYDIDHYPLGDPAPLCKVTIGPSIANAHTGLQAMRIVIQNNPAGVSVYQILGSDMTGGKTVGYSYALYPKLIAQDEYNYWVEIGYVKNVPNDATAVDPNDPLSELVLIKRWDQTDGTPLHDPNVLDKGWLTGSGSLTLENTTSTVAFFVKVGGRAEVRMFFDDLAFTPEPTALLLFGLPMLLMLRRRR